MKLRQLLPLSFFSLILSACHGTHHVTTQTPAAPALLWSDEFTGAANTPPDPTHWAYDDIHAGNGNHELEIYCGQPGPAQSGDCANYLQNAHLDGHGNLVITAIKMPDGQWTSGRLITQGKFTFTYGRAEARIKLPFGAGIWPAFWMLGDNISSVGWPASGEADMMENVPQLGPSTIRSSLHGKGYSGGDSLHGDFHFPTPQRVDTDYHTYGIIWSPNSVQYYVDDSTHPFVTLTPSNLPAGSTWAFNDHPFFLLLNLAIGGDWPGPPDSTTPNTVPMYVDYVRVYSNQP